MALFNRLRSGREIVGDVLAQLGLPVPQTIVGNTANDLAAQLWALLTYCGRRLIKPTGGHRWQALQRTWNLTTDPAETLYDLPVDWDSFIDSTSWSNSSSLPLVGPVGASQWSAMTARTLGPSTLSIVYRTRGNQFELFSSPSTPQNLALDYTSRGWVQHVDPVAGNVLQDALTADADIPVFDADLLTCYLKMRILVEKGFDTTVAMADFGGALEQAINADRDAKPVRTDGAGTYPFINVWANVPDTGYGA